MYVSFSPIFLSYLFPLFISYIFFLSSVSCDGNCFGYGTCVGPNICQCTIAPSTACSGVCTPCSSCDSNNICTNCITIAVMGYQCLTGTISGPQSFQQCFQNSTNCQPCYCGPVNFNTPSPPSTVPGNCCGAAAIVIQYFLIVLLLLISMNLYVQ
jgi:hypothetical protein